jgi:long-chain acyl-CoA synthetase
MSAQMAAWLQSRGLKPGARVAIMLPNVLQYPVAMAAVLRAGYTIVNVNPLYTPRELQHQLNDSGAEAIVVLENFAHTVADRSSPRPGQARGRRHHGRPAGRPEGHHRQPRGAQGEEAGAGVVAAAGGAVQARAGRRRALTLKPVTVGHDDVAFLQYTGGTTGVSKGAVLLHKHVIANVLQNEAWFGPTLAKPAPDLQFVCALPLYHIYALTVCALLGMRVGGMNLLIPNPRDMPGFIKELGKYRINIFPAVNTLYNGLLNQPDFANLDFSGLLVCPGGGMAVQKAGGRQVAQDDRHPDRRRLRPVRDLAGGDRQPLRHQRLHRHHRPAAALDRDPHPRRSQRRSPVPFGTAGEIACAARR